MEDFPKPEDENLNKAWAVGALKPQNVENRSAEELSQIAKDIVTNLVFTDRHIRDFDSGLLPTIFMPVALGAFAECSEAYVNDVGMLFEYYDKSFPRSINGYPIFSSLQILSKHDAKLINGI